MKKKKILFLIAIILIVIICILGYFIKIKIQKEKMKYEIQTISEYKYFVVKEDNKYGVIDAKGNKIIETKYEDVKIPNPEKAVFICYEKDNTKVLNEKSEEIFTEYKNIEPLRFINISSDLMYEKSVLRYEDKEKYGIIDFYGKIITKPIYEEIGTLQFKEGELLVKRDGKYGVMNINGAILVKPDYDKIESDKFYKEENGYKDSGYIVSTKTDEGYRYGYINIDGKVIAETKYNDLYRITEIDNEDIYIICAENGKYGLLKNDKKIIENEYQELSYSQSNNTIIGQKGRKYGVISIADGKTIIPFEYDQIDIAGEYIYATISGSTKTYNIKGEQTNINESLSIINVQDTDYKIYIETLNGKTIYNIYKNNAKITQKEYTYIEYLHENYFIACNANGKLGIISDDEKTIIEFNYNSLQKIENTNMIQAINSNTKITEIYSKQMKKICELENAKIENNKDYIKLYNDKEIKYVSKEEKEVKNTDIFVKSKIFAQKAGDKWGFVDKNGNHIIDFKYEKVTEINDYGFAGIKLDGKWGVINNEGKIVIEPKYELDNDEPAFIGEYYQVVYGNGEIYYTKHLK